MSLVCTLNITQSAVGFRYLCKIFGVWKIIFVCESLQNQLLVVCCTEIPHLEFVLYNCLRCKEWYDCVYLFLGTFLYENWWGKNFFLGIWFWLLAKETLHVSLVHCELLYLRRWMLRLRGHWMWPRALWYMVTCILVTYHFFSARLISSLNISAASFSKISVNICQITHHDIPAYRCLTLFNFMCSFYIRCIHIWRETNYDK